MSDDRASGAALVLLSSYNGADFIEQQIASIKSQTVRDWRLIVRDDGSTDDTVAIVLRLAAADPRIEIMKDGGGNLGAWRSFGRLLARAHACKESYCFFCDQDDVWLPEKMEKELAELRRIEAREPSSPAIVHTDLALVDANLAPIHSSFRSYQRMFYDRADPLGTFLVHNSLVGCTLAFNRVLADLAHPIPRGAPHDWWLALCAAAAGTVASIDESLVLYRQHQRNVVGAARARRFFRSAFSKPVSSMRSVFRALGESGTWAGELARRLEERGYGVSAQLRARDYERAYTGQLTTRVSALRQSRARPTRRLSRALFPILVALQPLFARQTLDRNR